MSRVVIHFEGSKALRSGFRGLFGNHVERARRNGIHFKMVAGGSNVETVKDFLRSCRKNPSDLNVLLVDSEGPAPSAAAAIRELRSRSCWDASAAVDDGQINFMVQAMEAWFIADRRALASHFGDRFNAGGLPSPRNAESISPQGLTDSIAQALRASGVHRGRRRYGKARDGARLLELLDETTVRQNCPSFGRLADFLSGGF